MQVLKRRLGYDLVSEVNNGSYDIISVLYHRERRYLSYWLIVQLPHQLVSPVVQEYLNTFWFRFGVHQRFSCFFLKEKTGVVESNAAKILTTCIIPVGIHFVLFHDEVFRRGALNMKKVGWNEVISRVLLKLWRGRMWCKCWRREVSEVITVQ